MKIIAIANQRGGVGKITIARELSACCAVRGYQTLGAAARTPSTSNVPAFLAEHLRRQMLKKDKQQLTEKGYSATTSAAPSHAKLGTNKCPDCGGSGNYYPEGYDNGVAECSHARLAAPKHD